MKPENEISRLKGMQQLISCCILELKVGNATYGDCLDVIKDYLISLIAERSDNQLIKR